MTLDLRIPPARRSRLANGALTLAAFAALVAAYSAILVRSRAVEAYPGFVAFLVGLALAAIAILAGIAAMVVVWRTGRKGGGRALLAILIGCAVMAGPAYVVARSFGDPQFDDVSTDLADPPRFERAARERGPNIPPPPAAIPPAQAEAQRLAHPDVATLKLELSSDEVAGLVAGLVEDRGWRVVGRTAFPRGGPPTGRIEAVARSRLLGLDEDVVIRIRSTETGSIVDMRSAGRVAGLDFGENAERIKGFLGDLGTAAAAAP